MLGAEEGRGRQASQELRLSSGERGGGAPGSGKAPGNLGLMAERWSREHYRVARESSWRKESELEASAGHGGETIPDLPFAAQRRKGWYGFWGHLQWVSHGQEGAGSMEDTTGEQLEGCSGHHYLKRIR